MQQTQTPQALLNPAAAAPIADSTSPQGPLPRKEKLLIAALCFLAAIRVLFCSFAFPFFAPTDEQLHLDAIIHYEHGYSPQNPLPTATPETASLIDLYQSTEYLAQRAPFAVRNDGWCASTLDRAPGSGIVTGHWIQHPNEEINQSRPYYRMEAAWYALGSWLGYRGIFRLYWAKSLNALAYGLTVLFGYLFARRCYGARSLVPLALVLMLLVFPQDIFFVLNPNALFPASCTAALWMLALIATHPVRNYWTYVVAGLLCALSFLLGFGNFSIFFPLFYLLFARTSLGNLRMPRKHSAVMLLGAVTPVAFWAICNHILLGGWSGTASKLRYLGWTPKSIAEIFHHPLFTPQGFAYFAVTLSRNFWRGELPWHGAARLSWIDWLYIASALAFAVTFLVRLIRREKKSSAETWADCSCLAMVVLSGLFLIFLSLRYDFGQTYYPSRALPYFVSGRIIIGVLVPFLILYLRGLEFIWRKILPNISPLYPVLALVLCIGITESLSLRPLFSSPYNLYGAMEKRGCNLPSFAGELKDTAKISSR